MSTLLPLQLLRVAHAYRASGADLPFGDPLRAHGVAMEGYFWRITDVDRGRSLIALSGVNRDRVGGHWATLGLGAWPAPVLALREAEIGWADPARLGALARDGEGAEIFFGDENRVRVDLGEDAQLDIAVDEARPWTSAGGGRALGGSSIFQAVPALNQYWHPWLLGGRVTGSARVGDEVWEFDGAQVYSEKNWGKEGFPDAWWWGQAQGFAEREACVAFAGGQVHSGPLRTEVTALVVRLPDGQVVRLGNPGLSPVSARVTDDTWDLRGKSLSGWTIDVHATAPLRDAHVLPVPLPSERRNTAGAIEHLGGQLSVEVRHRGSVVWQGHSTLAGLEHGGLARAEAELRRRGVPAGATGAPPNGA